jgi:hypothetical protein
VTGAAAAARALVALLILAALCTNAVDAARDGLLAQNVSYFTNQSNLLFVAVIAAGALFGGALDGALERIRGLTPAPARRDPGAPPDPRRPPWFDDVRGAVAFCLAMTGIIYALLVAPLDELLRWDIGWTGIVLHRLAPMGALADWLLTPRRRSPSARRILWWQLYPLGFLALTWFRGAVTGWYPYEFLDPTASSWAQVLSTTVIVLLAFLTIAALVHLGGGCLRRRKVPQVTATPAVP